MTDDDFDLWERIAALAQAMGVAVAADQVGMAVVRSWHLAPAAERAAIHGAFLAICCGYFGYLSFELVANWRAVRALEAAPAARHPS